ncbi:MAG TPA: Kdo hydroxylase family protein, partial [Rhizomicrobium sp.]|nr:Kdo hydroxylase family protein [Rhizomicrobium sp.]
MPEIIESLPLDRWTGPYDAALKARAVSALERGAVLFFPHLAFTLSDAEKLFLDAKVADGKAKNISL